MESFHDDGVWMSSESDEDNFDEYGPPAEDASFFMLELKPEGQSGGFHVRNRQGEGQRIVATQFHSGPRKRPAFNVGAVAKAIIHGTLDTLSNTPATLLVYDFSFLSHRSTRIKDASITFEFQAKKGSSNLGPTVTRVAPYGKHVMMQTTESMTRTFGGEGGVSGGAVVSISANMRSENSVEKTTTHAARVVGNNPCDEWSNYPLAQWSLEENESQRSGIMTVFRACILLTLENDEEFHMLPDVKVTPDLRTRLGSLVAFRRGDDPIKLNPASDPINNLDVDLVQHRWNLGQVDLDNLWTCTFYSTFEEAVKASRPRETMEEGVEKVTKIVEAAVAEP